MADVLNVFDYIAIGLVLLLSASFGLYFRFTGGRQKTTREFLMGDRSMGIIPVSFSLMATSYSAVTILGIPAETYLYGLQRIMADLGYPIGLLIASYLIVPVYFDTEVTTIYQYLGRRFGNNIKIVTSILYSLQMIMYMPIVLYAPSLALSFVTDLSVWFSVLSMGIICTFYSVMGGLKAVLWADVFQSMLMFIMNFALLIKGSMNSGGLNNVFKNAYEGQRLDMFNLSMNFTVRYTVWNTLMEGFMYGLFINGTTFTQVQRLLSAGTVKRAQKSLAWTIVLSTLFRVSGCLLGIVIYAYFKDCDPLSNENERIISVDQIIPFFILTMFGQFPGLPGVCVAGIFSASLSTMSSAINALVTVTLEDYIKPIIKHKNFKDTTMTLLAKSLALFYGGFCLFLTFVLANAKGVLEAGTVIVGIAGGPTLGVFCLGMFTLTANEKFNLLRVMEAGTVIVGIYGGPTLGVFCLGMFILTSNEMGTLIGLITGFCFHAWIGMGSLYQAPKYPALPLSTTGCETDMNSILYNNETTLLYSSSINASNTVILNNNVERYTFPLYRISFLWLTFLSALTTITVGYIASFIIGFRKSHNKVNPLHLSPVVRGWLCGYSKPKNEYTKVSKENKQIQENEETEFQL